MPNSDLPELIRGPWIAVATDQHGYVLDAEDMEECVCVTVVRGTAVPGVWTEGDQPQLAGSCRTEDVLYAHEDLDDDPSRVPTVWDQAQAVAEALNAGAVIGAAIAWRRMRDNTAFVKPKPESAALIAAVDELEQLNTRPYSSEAEEAK